MRHHPVENLVSAGSLALMYVYQADAGCAFWVFFSDGEPTGRNNKPWYDACVCKDYAYSANPSPTVGVCDGKAERCKVIDQPPLDDVWMI